MTKQTKTRELKLHSGVFDLLVNHQGSTREKAILEAAMNAVDAGSPTIDVRISRDTIEIVDQGRGFGTEEEVTRVFSTIGTPHEAGDAEFGRYRMGRCQLFRYGNNKWRSNGYEFAVDVKRDGNRHSKTTGLPHHPGCRIVIELYDRMSDAEVARTVTQLREWLEWMPAEVTIKGEAVSRDRAAFPWTEVTDDAYIRLTDEPMLRLYNKGAFVAAYGADELGSGGTVVTKDAVDVTYARNAVQTSCPVWRRIRRQIAAAAGTANRNKPITEVGRNFIARQMVTGQVDLLDAKTQAAKVFTMVDGTNLGLADFVKAAKNGIGLTPRGDRLGSFSHRSRIAPVLATETLARFDVSDFETLREALADRVNAAADAEALKRAMSGIPNGTYAYGAGDGADDGRMRVQEARRQALDIQEIAVAPLDEYKELMRSPVAMVPTNRLPRNMQSYFRLLDGIVRSLAVPGVRRLSACHSEDGVVGMVQSNQLFMNPLALPDPRGGVGAITATIAIMAATAMNGTRAEDEEDGTARTTELLCRPHRLGMLANELMAALVKQDKQASKEGARAILAMNDAAAYVAVARTTKGEQGDDDERQDEAA